MELFNIKNKGGLKPPFRVSVEAVTLLEHHILYFHK